MTRRRWAEVGTGLHWRNGRALRCELPEYHHGDDLDLFAGDQRGGFRRLPILPFAFTSHASMHMHLATLSDQPPLHFR